MQVALQLRVPNQSGSLILSHMEKISDRLGIIGLSLP